MKHVHYAQVKAEEVEEGAEGVAIRWLITEKDGAANFVMRHFEIAPGGYTPRHAHEWEHEVFILRGVGEVLGARGEEHQFRATGDETVEMLCLIPARKTCGK